MDTAWIGVDWGTSALRVWALAPDGALPQRGAAPIVCDSTTATLAGLSQIHHVIHKDATCPET